MQRFRSRIELDLRSYQERVLPEHLQNRLTDSDRRRDRTFDFLRVMQGLSRWTMRSF